VDGLRVYDISNPTNLINVGYIHDSGQAWGVAVSGNYAYLANSGDGLRVYDISNPTNVISVGHIHDGGVSGNAYNVAVSGNYACLANGYDGLRVYDISDPTNPINVGHANDGDAAYGIAVSGNYAYLANDNDGLRVYDISNPTNVINVGHIDDGGVALSVAVSGHYAYLANWNDGLRVYDVAPPDAVLTRGLTVANTVSAAAFVGDGSGLTNVPGDNLGNHIATQTLNLNGNYLSGDGDNEGIAIQPNGSAEIWGADPLLRFLDATGNEDRQASIRTSFQTAIQITPDPATEQMSFWVSDSTATGENRVMTLRGDGHVGIGTAAPATALHVRVDQSATNFGGIRIDNVNPTVSGERTVFLDLANNDASSARTYRLHNVGNVSGRSGNFEIWDIQGNAARLAISPAGNVGIGTTSPTHAKVEISGSQNTSLNYGYLNNSGGTGTSSGSNPYSLYASDRIAASEFNAFSDARIKNIQGRSDGTADLKTLLGIQITDYTYKDTIAKGNRSQKKVIAQQVEQVYPQAVSKSTDAVPDIYQRATLKDGWVQLATDLKVGDRVKLIGDKENGVYPVLEVRAGAFRTDFKSAGDQVFVYGREVSDFRTVDYEAIAMLNVSATQEIHRELTELKAENADLKKKADRVGELAQQNAALESRLAALEQLLNRQSVALNGGAR
jgi:hypothetical protein